jgi:hypothetical protein
MSAALPHGLPWVGTKCLQGCEIPHCKIGRLPLAFPSRRYLCVVHGQMAKLLDPPDWWKVRVVEKEGNETQKREEKREKCAHKREKRAHRSNESSWLGARRVRDA